MTPVLIRYRRLAATLFAASLLFPIVAGHAQTTLPSKRTRMRPTTLPTIDLFTKGRSWNTATDDWFRVIAVVDVPPSWKGSAKNLTVFDDEDWSDSAARLSAEDAAKSAGMGNTAPNSLRICYEVVRDGKSIELGPRDGLTGVMKLQIGPGSNCWVNGLQASRLRSPCKLKIRAFLILDGQTCGMSNVVTVDCVNDKLDPTLD